MLSSTYLARNMNSSKVTLYSNREPNSKCKYTASYPCPISPFPHCIETLGYEADNLL